MYTPHAPPSDPAALPGFLNTELQALAQALLQSQPYAYIQTLNAAPVRPREGLIAKADGTNWNPGSGAGVYVYLGGAWLKFSTGPGGGMTNPMTTPGDIIVGGVAGAPGRVGIGLPGQVATVDPTGVTIVYTTPVSGVTFGELVNYTTCPQTL